MTEIWTPLHLQGSDQSQALMHLSHIWSPAHPWSRTHLWSPAHPQSLTWGPLFQRPLQLHEGQTSTSSLTSLPSKRSPL